MNLGRYGNKRKVVLMYKEYYIVGGYMPDNNFKLFI